MTDTITARFVGGPKDGDQQHVPSVDGSAPPMLLVHEEVQVEATRVAEVEPFGTPPRVGRYLRTAGWSNAPQVWYEWRGWHGC